MKQLSCERLLNFAAIFSFLISEIRCYARAESNYDYSFDETTLEAFDYHDGKALFYPDIEQRAWFAIPAIIGGIAAAAKYILDRTCVKYRKTHPVHLHQLSLLIQLFHQVLF
jgi:hypothetical protein